MPSTNNVHHARTSEDLRTLHGALLDIFSVMNRPQPDEMLLSAAGVKLDRALFPLIVGIGRFGPIGIVDLAERGGRDHTTVSRQVTKLESLGLVARVGSAADRRVRLATLTPEGRAMLDKIDAARARIGRAVFADWPAADIATLATLLSRFAATISAIQTGD